MLKDICVLNPHRNWASRLLSLKHNLWLIAETAFVAGIITGLWSLCYHFEWPLHVHKETDPLMVSTAILVCAAFFVFVASTLFTQVREKNAKLSRAILLGDEVEFMLQRDEKVQTMMHVVVGGFGAATLALFTIVGYESIWGGAIIIFCVSACIVVYFIAMLEMQQIKRIVWIQDNAPEAWLTQSVTEFFQKYREQNRKELPTEEVAIPSAA